ncbi:hypothetical protein D9M71_644750 [compost metagenome]
MLAGQTAIARKVFELVPIQEAWPAVDIYGALRTSNTGADTRVVRRCLGELKDQGLIREPVNGHFQRAAVTIKPKGEQAMPHEVKQTVKAPQNPEVAALDALATLSGEVSNLADEIGQRMKKLATRIEEVALSVEADRETNAEALAKFKQLQSLLKGI